jgi:predicted tellurium resistance membrane protein TerC
VLGLAISIPMIIAGAALIMMVLDRLPILIWLGAALLGWIAGDVIVSDPADHPFLQRLIDGRIELDFNATSAMLHWSPHFALDGDLLEYLSSALGVAFVLIVGSIWRRSKMQKPSVFEVK